MKRLIPQFGDACLQSRGDAFSTLARSIVGQQIRSRLHKPSGTALPPRRGR